ncbi:MAG: tol-pal system-associated acyl-CoA thioesterase [Rhodoblastus sp.]|nr:MAG: tol-pal system-associated acyl-CoA thioesterase [Rhodoblastus sp.]
MTAPALGGRLQEGVHTLDLRVYYEDTDFSGLVYHASYLRFLERGRTEWLRALGVGQRDLHEGAEQAAFVVRRMEIDWLRPARMDDVIRVETRATALSGASATLAQRVLRDDVSLVEAQVRIAVVAGGRPRRLPEAARARIAATTPSATRDSASVSR